MLVLVFGGNPPSVKTADFSNRSDAFLAAFDSVCHILDTVRRQKTKHSHGLSLADSMTSVLGMQTNPRIPIAIIDDDRVVRCQIDTTESTGSFDAILLLQYGHQVSSQHRLIKLLLHSIH